MKTTPSRTTRRRVLPIAAGVVAATVTGDRFAGDRQVSLTTSAGQLVGTFDALDGKVVIPFTAPASAGPLTLTLTGAQTGKVVTAKVTVR